MTIFQPIFVDASVNDLLIQYAEVLAKLKASSESANNTDTSLSVNPIIESAQLAIENETVSDLIFSYVKDACMLLNVPELEVEGLFTLLLALVYVSANRSTKVESDLVNSILNSFQESTSEKGLLKLKLLTQLFNTLTPTSAQRFATYTTLVKVAGKHNQLQSVAKSIDHLRAWSIDWQTPAKNLSGLYALLTSLFWNHGHWHATVHTIVKHIDHLFQSGKPLIPEVEGLYLQAVVAGLASLKQVTDLTGLYLSPATSRIPSMATKLVTAYVHGDYMTYVNEIEPHLTKLLSAIPQSTLLPAVPDLLKSIKVKFQMLYFTTLKVGHAHELSMIAADLNLDSTRLVEILFVQAVNHNLVRGKIDGISQQLTLASAAKFHLEVNDWHALFNDLDAWKLRLIKVSGVVEKLRDDDDDDDAVSSGTSELADLDLVQNHDDDNDGDDDLDGINADVEESSHLEVVSDLDV